MPIKRSVEELDDAQLDAARTIAKTINTCDPEPLIERLGPQATFESQSSFDVLKGRDEVANYLREKMAAVKTGGIPAIGEVGRINFSPSTSPKGSPGVIISQQNIVGTFWLPKLDEDGKIGSIFGCTVAPSPTSAVGLGERPGLNEEKFHELEGQRIGRHREWVKGLDGPVEFIAFILFSGMAQEWQTRLELVSKCFPGSRFRISIHDLNSTDSSLKSLAHSEAQEFQILGYPAVAVVKGGQMIRSARGSNIIDQVIADLEQMGELPSTSVS